ncbi:predicted protein [Uncinocarpus reesii 1704]|uniref:Ima1 N-terminal domain-containing protein n=1 Tax=Uncinocarpus reesii (strain UAMH 1704) TaxID=336963 RepID=C4JJX5_UNCRE|nr:uncharacterized protein UREG_01932 [Uncinocarpus reesii 1704]EEP77083.1 predicted protein [Uncinocarpus reesii 1704]
MAPFFKKRLQCFYCGSRSAQLQKSAIRQWQCRECQAVNYLDETLASYLPPQSHPEYEVYEASYPAYRQSLEDRYPQVCENCEPRVISRIKRAGYEAKADHLRRMMERSRGGRTVRNKRKWRWRSLLVSTGAVAFWASVAGQLAWDIIGFMADTTVATENQQRIQLSKSLLRSCLKEGQKHGVMPIQCALALQPYAGLALILGVLSLWWNPKLRHKVEGRSGRISGAREYYRIQIVVLVVRFVAWTVLQDASITGLNPKLVPAVHSFMAILIIVTTIASRAAIRFSIKPLVSWNDNIGSLISKRNGDAELSSQSFSNPQSSSISLSQSLPRFPVANLAPAPAHVNALGPESYIPPTPPPDMVVDSDAMDWTPSQQTLQPTFHISRNQPEPDAPPIHPSPFRGQLPAAPKPLSWQLRNPERQPIVKSIENKPNPFHTAPILHPSSNIPQQNQIATKSTDMVMAPPRFFPPNDLKAETGLESLFDKAFSIAESPKTERRSMSKMPDRGPIINKPLHIIKSIFLVVCLGLWVGSQSLALPKNTTETVVLGLSFLVTGFSLLELLMRPMMHWKMIDIFLSLAELVGCVYLALVRAGQFGDPTAFDKAGPYLVAFLTGQEMFGLRSMFSASRPVVAAKMPIKQEIKRPTSPPLLSCSLSTSSGERTPTRSSFISAPALANKSRSSPSKRQPQSFKAPSIPQPLDPSSSFLNRQNTFTPLAKPEYPLSLPNSFSGLAQSQLLSSSFGSTERFMSPASTASVTSTEYDASTISEPPSPILSTRHRTPGPSITSLSLDDSPIPMKNIPPTPRYSLRSRRR